MRASSPRRTGPTGFGDFRFFWKRIPIGLAHAVIARAARAVSLCSTRVASESPVQQAACARNGLGIPMRLDRKAKVRSTDHQAS